MRAILTRHPLANHLVRLSNVPDRPPWNHSRFREVDRHRSAGGSQPWPNIDFEQLGAVASHHPTLFVRVRPRFNEANNDLSLTGWVPARRTRCANHGHVQRLSAPPISGPKVGATVDGKGAPSRSRS